MVKHVGPLYVTGPVVNEINEINDENELIELGLVIIEPELADAYAAASQSGPTSFQDRLCPEFGFCKSIFSLFLPDSKIQSP